MFEICSGNMQSNIFMTLWFLLLLFSIYLSKIWRFNFYMLGTNLFGGSKLAALLMANIWLVLVRFLVVLGKWVVFWVRP